MALQALLARVQDLQLVEAAAPALTDSTFLRGVTRLPLQFRARAAWANWTPPSRPPRLRRMAADEELGHLGRLAGDL